MMLLPFMLLALGVDTFAVSLSLGLSGLERREWLRVGAVFALFEGLMPAVGLLIGRGLSGVLGQAAGYLAVALLLVLGLKEIREALLDDDDDDDDDDEPAPSKVRGGRLLLTALSVSIDELCLGFSLSVIHPRLAAALVFIAAQALFLTFVGLALGQRIGKRIGERAELAGAVVLVLLAVALLIEMISHGGS